MEHQMTPFCNDLDLLHWEPNIFHDGAFASQTLLAGSASLSGTTLTIASGSFIAAHIEPNQVVVLSGALAGSFPIVSVDSATQLTISVLYDGLFPSSGSAVASPVGTATGVTFAIRTFWPQAEVISEILQQCAGIIPGDPRTAEATILNPQALRRPCLLGVLQMIYGSLSGVPSAPHEYDVRSDLYQSLYQRALRSTIVDLDLNGDGCADCRRALNMTELVRR
jgi:hypothetical protein